MDGEYDYEISFWMKHPDGTGTSVFVDFFYSDGTDTGFVLNSITNGWDFFDVTSNLEAGNSLIGFSIFGVSAGETDRTFRQRYT